jgi:hypothetical protein
MAAATNNGCAKPNSTNTGTSSMASSGSNPAKPPISPARSPPSLSRRITNHNTAATAAPAMKPRISAQYPNSLARSPMPMPTKESALAALSGTGFAGEASQFAVSPIKEHGNYKHQSADIRPQGLANSERRGRPNCPHQAYPGNLIGGDRCVYQASYANPDKPVNIGIVANDRSPETLVVIRNDALYTIACRQNLIWALSYPRIIR